MAGDEFNLKNSVVLVDDPQDDDNDGIFDFDNDPSLDLPKEVTEAVTALNDGGAVAEGDYSLDDFIQQAHAAESQRHYEFQSQVAQATARIETLETRAEVRASELKRIDALIAQFEGGLEQAQRAQNALAVTQIQSALSAQRAERAKEAAQLDGMVDEYRRLDHFRQTAQYKTAPGGALAGAFQAKHAALLANPFYAQAVYDISNTVSKSVPITDLKHYAEIERQLASFYPHLGLKVGRADPTKVAVGGYSRARPRAVTASAGEGAAPRAQAPAGKVNVLKGQAKIAERFGLLSNKADAEGWLRQVKEINARSGR